MIHVPSPRRDRNTAYGVPSPERDRRPNLNSSLLNELAASWGFNTLQDSVSGINLANTTGVDLATEPGVAIFNGANYLTTPSTSSLQAGDIDFTIALRIYLVSTGFYGILNKWSSAITNQEWEIISNDGLAFYVSNPSQSSFTFARASTGLNVPGWNTVVAEHDSVNNQVRIACNFGAVVSVPWSEGIRVSNAELAFGAYSDSYAAIAPSGTKLDYVGIWKRMLTADEKTQINLEYPF